MTTVIGALPFEKGSLKIAISDERAKIQVNSLVDFPEGRQFNVAQHNLWERFANRLLQVYEVLEDVEMEETDPTTIINSIKDWIDSGDDEAITGLSGAESSYYEDLDPPYACKNGPFTHLGEISLVKGVTPELFFGFGELMGLSNYLTVYGATATDDNRFTFDGKININTAELPVLAALLEEGLADWAQTLVAYRDERTDGVYAPELPSVSSPAGVSRRPLTTSMSSTSSSNSRESLTWGSRPGGSDSNRSDSPPKPGVAVPRTDALLPETAGGKD